MQIMFVWYQVKHTGIITVRYRVTDLIGCNLKGICIILTQILTKPAGKVSVSGARAFIFECHQNSP
jgi:hypothetical protein